MKKLALVLSGGSSKGFAHIGVIKFLEENGIKPDLVVGTSMGAMVGGIYSLGYRVSELETMAKSFKKLGRFSLHSTLFKESALDITAIKKFLGDAVGNKTHKDCKIPFVSVATELDTGKEKHFKSGKLKETILASCSVPGLFPRIQVGKKFYVDGGCLNNLPEDVAREMLSDAVVLSVDVIGEYSKQVVDTKFKTMDNVINAMTLMNYEAVKNKPKYADLRLTITLPEVQQTEFKPAITEIAISRGYETMKENYKKLIKLLKEE